MHGITPHPPALNRAHTVEPATTAAASGPRSRNPTAVASMPATKDEAGPGRSTMVAAVPPRERAGRRTDRNVPVPTDPPGMDRAPTAAHVRTNDPRVTTPDPDPAPSAEPGRPVAARPADTDPIARRAATTAANEPDRGSSPRADPGSRVAPSESRAASPESRATRSPPAPGSVRIDAARAPDPAARTPEPAPVASAAEPVPVASRRGSGAHGREAVPIASEPPDTDPQDVEPLRETELVECLPWIFLERNPMERSRR